MKIIAPIELNQGNTTSNAPSDGFSIWAPLGRNFLTDLDLKAMAALGSTGYFACDSSDTILYIVDLDTGDVEEFEVGKECSAVNPSPDGLYFAVTTKPSSSSYRVTVYRVSDKADVYSFDAGSQSRTHNDWSFDSALFLHSTLIETALTPASEALRSVDASTWTVAQESARYNEITQAVTGISETWTPSFFDGAQVLAAHRDANKCSIKFRAARLVGNGTDYRHVLLSFNLSDMSYTSRILGSQYANDYLRLVHNPERSELLLFFPGAPQAVSDSTLADAGLSPSLPAVDQVSINSAGTEAIFRSTSITPKFSRIATVDYSADGSLDSILDSEGRSIAYSDDYYVATLEDFGYALINRVGDTLETETNPSVTAGDVYTYQDNNYEALADTTDRPDQGVVADPPTWLNLGAINRLRMFDGKLDSLTRSLEELIIDVQPGALANGIALFNVDAQTVQITVTDPDAGEVYDTGVISMRDNSGVLGWHNYFFSPRPQKRDLARIDLPTYPSATVTVTLGSTSDPVAIGEVVLGRVQELGKTQYGSTVGITDSSRKERDQFGNFNILERPFSKRAEYDVHIQRAATSGVQRILASYRAKPIVYLTSIEEEALLLYGFYKDFQINYENFSISAVTITAEGL